MKGEVILSPRAFVLRVGLLELDMRPLLPYSKNFLHLSPRLHSLHSSGRTLYPLLVTASCLPPFVAVVNLGTNAGMDDSPFHGIMSCCFAVFLVCSGSKVGRAMRLLLLMSLAFCAHAFIQPNLKLPRASSTSLSTSKSWGPRVSPYHTIPRYVPTYLPFAC